MKNNQFEIFEELLNLKYQRKQNSIKALNEREALLRSRIRQINEQNAEAERSASQQMRSIGADVIWKAWVGKTIRALNLELAQVLAQKEILLKDIRREYGKVLVTAEISRKQKKELLKERSRKMLSGAADFFLFR